MADNDKKPRWAKNLEDICGDQAQSGVDADAKGIAALKELMSKIPEGAGLLQVLEDNDIYMGVDHQLEEYFGYGVFKDGKPKALMISVESMQNPAAALGVLFHEAQHMLQRLAGFGYVSPDMSAEDNCWSVRILEADAETSAIDLCYQLKLAGFPEAFDHYLEATGFASCAMAKAYQSVIEADESRDFAKRAAFDAFFADERQMVETYDAIVLNGYNDAELYKTEPNATITCAELEKMGTIAKGSDYLRLPGKPSMDDPLYREGFSEENQAIIKAMEAKVEKIRPKAKKRLVKRAKPFDV